MGNVIDQAQLNNLSRRVTNVENLAKDMGNLVEGVNRSLNSMNGSISSIQTDLVKLSEDFRKMFYEQQRLAALQNASTEIVRVRQELEQNFGNYKIVRETMLGVLQATDVALVKKNTISRVSEEIMLSTPEYWLAPCLVAVAAWISNDRDLAERAIKEACRRDEEKTAITMALICRRNNRTQTCYEWLAVYFAKQDAADFSEGSYAYIDAYVNGIFGRDERHMCDDYINKWLNEIKGNSSVFESSQEDLWKTYCERFKLDTSGQYPALASNVSEFPQINEYISRINSVDSISDNFHGIVNAYVDQDTLKKSVDKNLISLICRYDKKEEPLRNEERLLQKIKDFDGDTEKARQYMQAEELLTKERRLNLVEVMSGAIVKEDDSSPSQKKTAVSFLSHYIKKGFNTYIDEKKSEFPSEITINVDGWSGKTSDCSNSQQLMNSFESFENSNREMEVAAATSKRPTMFMAGAIAVGVLSLILLFKAWPLGIISLGVAAYLLYRMFTEKKQMDSRISLINSNYADRIRDGKASIARSMQDWNNAKAVVTEFQQKPTTEIIA